MLEFMHRLASWASIEPKIVTILDDRSSFGYLLSQFECLMHSNVLCTPIEFELKLMSAKLEKMAA